MEGMCVCVYVHMQRVEDGELVALHFILFYPYAVWESDTLNVA